MKVWLVVVLCVVVAAGAGSTPSEIPEVLLKHLQREGAEKPESFIIAGEPAAAKSAPYVVSLSVSELVSAHVCGGAIIGKEWVVTAAHCVALLKELNGDVVGFPVYAGTQNRSDAAQIRFVDYVITHKGYNGQIGSDDISLLHVSQAFSFDERVQQAVLPSWREGAVGLESATYGWGLTDPDGELVSGLRVGTATILDMSECKAKLNAGATLTSRQICASSKACYGDGGSPLVIQEPNALAELFGIASWGYMPCGYDEKPIVYTAIAEYIDWIVAAQWDYYFLHAN